MFSDPQSASRDLGHVILAEPRTKEGKEIQTVLYTQTHIGYFFIVDSKLSKEKYDQIVIIY